MSTSVEFWWLTKLSVVVSKITNQTHRHNSMNQDTNADTINTSFFLNGKSKLKKKTWFLWILDFVRKSSKLTLCKSFFSSATNKMNYRKTKFASIENIFASQEKKKHLRSSYLLTFAAPHSQLTHVTMFIAEMLWNSCSCHKWFINAKLFFFLYRNGG